MTNLKKTIPYLFVVGMLMVFTFSGFKTKTVAPSSHVAYMSINKVLGNIPEFNKKRSKLDSVIYQFDEVLKVKMMGFQQKQQAFIRDSAKLNKIVIKDKIKELQSMSQSIQTFKQVSKQELKKQDSVMIQPILKELQESIDKVSKEQGYTLVINADVRANNGSPMILFTEETIDINDLVLKAYQQKVAQQDSSKK